MVPASAVFGLAALVVLLAWRGPCGRHRGDRPHRAGPVTGVVTGARRGTHAVGGVRIWYRVDHSDRCGEEGVVLLSIASVRARLFWPPAFLRAMSAAGYRVVRYDQRSAGASSRMPDWSRQHPYSLIDMAGDGARSSTSFASTALTSSGSPQEDSSLKRSRSNTPSVSDRSPDVDLRGSDRQLHARTADLAADQVRDRGPSAAAVPRARR